MKLNNEKFIKNLHGMVKYETVSSADPEKINTQAFLDFHKYLE